MPDIGPKTELETITGRLESVINNDPVKALQAAHYSPHPDSHYENRVQIATAALKSPTLSSEISGNRRLIICRPMFVMDHLTATVLNLFITAKLNDPCAKFLADVERYYPEKYPAYIRDLGRLVSTHKLKRPPFIPPVKDDNFEDPFNVGIPSLKALQRKLRIQDTKIIADQPSLHQMPPNLHPVFQTVFAMTFIGKYQQKQMSSNDAAVLWETACKKFNLINFELKFHFFLSIHDQFPRITASQIFGDLLEEFFTSAPPGERNNISMLLSIYYYIKQTNDTYFTGLITKRPNLKQNFIHLAVNGNPLESAFALKALAGYINQPDTETKIQEIVRAIFPHGINNHQEKVKLSSLLIHIDHPQKREIAEKCLPQPTSISPNISLDSKPIPPEPTPVGTLATSYRFMIADTIRKRFSTKANHNEQKPHDIVTPEKRIQIATTLTDPRLRAIAKRYEDPLMKLLAQYQSNQNATMNSHIKKLLETASNVSWTTTTSPTEDQINVNPEKSPIGYLIVLPPGHSSLQTMGSIAEPTSMGSSYIAFRPEAVTDKYAAALLSYALSAISQASQPTPTYPKGVDLMLLRTANSYSAKVSTLELSSQGKFLELVNHFIKEIDLKSLFSILKQDCPDRRKLFEKLDREIFGSPAKNPREKSGRETVYLHAFLQHLNQDTKDPAVRRDNILKYMRVFHDWAKHL